MPATLPPGVADPEIRWGTRDEQAPLYHVVLLDDDDHTYEYVIEMLIKLFACSESSAWNHAVEVDNTGRTIVITCELPPGGIRPRSDSRLRSRPPHAAL